MLEFLLGWSVGAAVGGWMMSPWVLPLGHSHRIGLRLLTAITAPLWIIVLLCALFTTRTIRVFKELLCKPQSTLLTPPPSQPPTCTPPSHS